MRKIPCFITLCVILFCASSHKVFSQESLETRACDHRRSQSKDNFLPFARLVLTPVFICDNSAVSLLGEAGGKIYRINGTYGTFFGDCQRLKIGGEFLGEKLKYNFSSGHVHRWMHQWAVGGKYQYLLDWDCFLEGIELSGLYSCAQSDTLCSAFCPIENATLFRRIAGASHWDVEGGLVLSPFECSHLTLTIGYDSAFYHRKFSQNKRVSGVSGTLWYNQRFMRCLVLDIKAEFRRAYNWLEGKLAWNDRFWGGDVSVGIFGGHVWGKEHLPDSSNVGGEIRYAWDVNECCPSFDPCEETCCYVCNDLADWISEPAVYIPQVLAIAEQSICRGPISSLIILNGGDSFPFGQSFEDISGFFNNREGNNPGLIFLSNNLPPGVTITSDGVLLVNNQNTSGEIQTFSATITASNGCGSTSQTVTISLASNVIPD
jgi:hypothetical protein